MFQSGASVVILGPPNAGKSTLFNCLVSKDQSIVTDIEGTTRDVIEKSININGLPILLKDTAGIRESGDCLLYTSPSPRDATLSRMPSSA